MPMNHGRHIPLLFLFLPAVIWLPAQDAVADSLMQLTQSRVDSQRIDALIALGRRLRAKDAAQALKWENQAAEQAAAAGYPLREAKALNDIGVTYGMQEDYATAMTYFRRSQRVHQANNNPVGVADGYNNLGIAYKHLGDYPQSLDAHLKALAIYDQAGDLSGRGASLINIGITYDLMKDPAQALSYFEKALAIKEQLQDEPGRAMALHNIALMYEAQGKYQQALQYLFEHLNILERANDRLSMPNTFNSIGTVYLAMGAYDEAGRYFEQCRELAQTLGMKRSWAHALYNLARLDVKRQQPRAAVAKLEEHLGMVKEMGAPFLQRQSHDLMAEALAALGDYAGAYRHLKEAAVFRDSLFDTEKNESFRKWQARFEVYEKDRQLDRQEQELQLLADRARADRQLRWALVAAFALAGFGALAFYQKYRLRQQTNEVLLSKNQLIESQKAEIEQANAALEKRMLRAQLNPHFIFNALGAIQHFITANDRPAALKYLAKFSSLLRQVLEDSATTIVVLEEEIKLLKTYLDLEALRFDQGFSYHIEVAPGLDSHTVEVPLFFIQPFVENAILHGLMPKPSDRQLHIVFFASEGFTCCRITDNGIGRAAAAGLKAQKAGLRPSRGIELAQRRLATLNKNPDEPTLVSINDRYHPDGSAAGTEVIIQIPAA